MADFDIIKAARILAKDKNAIKNWEIFCTTLIPNDPGVQVALGQGIKNNTVLYYSAFLQILSTWHGGNGNAATMDKLIQHLKDLGLVNTAQTMTGEIKTIVPPKAAGDNIAAGLALNAPLPVTVAAVMPKVQNSDRNPPEGAEASGITVPSSASGENIARPRMDSDDQNPSENVENMDEDERYDLR